jgi:hypothetical protein
VQKWCNGENFHVRLLPRAGLSAGLPSVSWGAGGGYRGTADDVLGILGTPHGFFPGEWKYGKSSVKFDAGGNVTAIDNKGELRVAAKDDRGYLVGSAFARK